MDLGQLRTLGLGAVSLRPLVLARRLRVALVSGRDGRAALLVAGAGGVLRIRRRADSMGFGFGFGNIGWVPLAPYEMFHPWWGRGYYGGFNRGMNITNVNIATSTETLVWPMVFPR